MHSLHTKNKYYSQLVTMATESCPLDFFSIRAIGQQLAFPSNGEKSLLIILFMASYVQSCNESTFRTSDWHSSNIVIVIFFQHSFDFQPLIDFLFNQAIL